MTLTEQILHLWRQGLDTYEIARRTGETEAAVHREIIRDRAARQRASAGTALHRRPVLV